MMCFAQVHDVAGVFDKAQWFNGDVIAVHQKMSVEPAPYLLHPFWNRGARLANEGYKVCAILIHYIWNTHYHWQVYSDCSGIGVLGWHIRVKVHVLLTFILQYYGCNKHFHWLLCSNRSGVGELD